jgi:hypothetical protein
MIHPVRNQHYVPQFLLRNFSSNSSCTHLWLFDKVAFAKKWKAIEERSIKSVASEEYFYDYEVSHEHDSFEYQFGLIENGVAPILEKLISTKDLDCLLQGEPELLALFVALQMSRTKGSLSNTEKFSVDFTDKMRGFGVDVTQVDPKGLWRAHMLNAHQYSEILLRKKWILQKSNQQFYCSDNPVALNNSTNRSIVRGTLGLKSEGIEIYLPLGSSLVLNICCERVYKDIPRGTYQLQDVNIEYCNWLQIRNAERFVFSSKNNFELAVEVTIELQQHI